MIVEYAYSLTHNTNKFCAMTVRSLHTQDVVQREDKSPVYFTLRISSTKTL
jgi:hypothetical protein